jgi:hypothetical protein
LAGPAKQRGLPRLRPGPVGELALTPRKAGAYKEKGIVRASGEVVEEDIEVIHHYAASAESIH